MDRQTGTHARGPGAPARSPTTQRVMLGLMPFEIARKGHEIWALSLTGRNECRMRRRRVSERASRPPPPLRGRFSLTLSLSSLLRSGEVCVDGGAFTIGSTSKLRPVTNLSHITQTPPNRARQAEARPGPSDPRSLPSGPDRPIRRPTEQACMHVRMCMFEVVVKGRGAR